MHCTGRLPQLFHRSSLTLLTLKINRMDFDLLSLDVDVLNRLYTAKEKELESAILSSTAWDEVSIRRKALTEISSALHTKLCGRQMQSRQFPGGR